MGSEEGGISLDPSDLLAGLIFDSNLLSNVSYQALTLLLLLCLWLSRLVSILWSE